MDDIGQMTLRPAPAVQTPQRLTKGGETKPGYRARVTADYFRATFDRSDSGKMMARFGVRNPLPMGKSKGYQYTEEHRYGWVRKFKPYVENRDGQKDYETWELPGAVDQAELRWLFRKFPNMNLTQLHVAMDFIDQGYPLPWQCREILKNSKPRTKKPRGRRHEGDDGSQTWYLGKRSSSVAWRFYQKGMKLRADKDWPDAPLDWVRAEFELHERWLLEHAKTMLLMGADDALVHVAEAVIQYYFKGDTCGLLPEREGIELSPPVETYTPDLKTVFHMLRQYGPLLKELQKQGVLGRVVEVVRPSRTAEWRNEQVVERVLQEGVEDALKGIEKLMYGGDRLDEFAGEAAANDAA